ncbi:hypothetical protein M569_08754, partial [Genlisea aurea]
LLVVLLSVSRFSSAGNILEFGADPDGYADSGDALLSAWADACNSRDPSVIYVPKGRFLINTNLQFRGPCENDATVIRIDGVLVAPSDYEAIGNANNWLLFNDVSGVSILGGTLDGRGHALWACKKSGGDCPVGATTIGIWNSQNVEVVGLETLNSQMFHIVVNGCRDVKLQQVTVLASEDSPNTDGIHVQFSNRVTILDSVIGSGDDCISIGPGTSDLWIENVVCGPGHGISIGSLGKKYDEEGVENVVVKNVRFKGTENGVRIKTWARPSKGFVRGVVFQHAVMHDVRNPIVIDQNYCPYHYNCPQEESGVRISDVLYEDIQGTSATEVAMKFDCSKTTPCENIRLENVNLRYNEQEARSSCANAAGTVAGNVQPSSCL